MPIDQLGDLNALAAAIPGVQFLAGADGAADAFSVFGLGGDQNNTVLNGLLFGDATVPRDAALFASLSTSPYDVSRGGFSGGQLQLRTRAGSNFIRRTGSSTLLTPAQQWTDAAGRATAQRPTTLSLGGSASGPLSRDRLFYNGALQFDRRQAEWVTLLSAPPVGLTTAGVAPDSVARFLDILSSQGVPTSVGATPSARLSERGSFLGSLDFTPPTSARGNTYTVSGSGNWSRLLPAGGAGGGGGGGFGGQTGQGGTSLTTPSRDGERLSYSGTVQLRHSGLLGVGGLLTETTVGLSADQQQATPFWQVPAGSVRVNSLLPDGTSAVRTLGFGGSPSLNTTAGGQTASVLNTLSWFSRDNRHRVKMTSEFRWESYWQDLTFNELGTYTYLSLADLEQRTAATFTRQLAPRRREGRQVVGAWSLGDAWRPSEGVQVQYGLRMDANRFLEAPARNDAVAAALGIRNDVAPNGLYLSPRLGVSWTYGTAAQVAAVPGMVRAPRAVVRGGVGVFQNLPRVQFLGGSLDNTGLSTGLQQLTCQGGAVPQAQWDAYADDPAQIPRTCLDGSFGAGFANATPNIQFFAPDFVAPRAVRANLQWSGAVLANRFLATADVTSSQNLAQSGFVDRNFADRLPQATLASEGGRPLYAPISAIVPATGQVAWRAVRTDTLFGQVREQRSDLRGESRQLSVSLRPLAFSSRFSWNATYVLADGQEQFWGFASTAGDPRTREVAPVAQVPRHQLQLSLSYNAWDVVRVGWFGAIRSGTRYTPQVVGDINGDGFGSNDRAFLFDPAGAQTDAALARSLSSLLASTTPEARACLQRQIGQVAGRNSCVGPWTSTGTLTLGFNSLRIGLPQRANLSIQVANPIGGLDRLLHGETNQRGWGQVIPPDPTLLYVRGFDPAANRFVYEVNERFGTTRLAASALRTPVALTAILRVDLGPPRERQQLQQQLDRGRRAAGTKPTLAQLRASVAAGVPNPLQQILLQADTLELTAQQRDELARLNRTFVLARDRRWEPVSRELADLPDRYDADAAYDRVRRAREATIDDLIRVVPTVKQLLTPAQQRRLPDLVQTQLDVRTLRAIRAGTAGQGGGFGMGGGAGRGG